MYLYIALFSLFALVLVLAVVERRRVLRRRRKIQQSWKDLRDTLTALEQNKDRLYVTIYLALKTKDPTPGLPNTIQPETY